MDVPNSILQLSKQIVQNGPTSLSILLHANQDQQAAWSSGMILGLGPRGPGFESLNSPFMVFFCRYTKADDGDRTRDLLLTKQMLYH